MDLSLPKQKVKELTQALQNRHTSPVIVYGPPQCGKSTLIAHTLKLLGLSPVEVENVTTFNPKYLLRNEVGLVDQDIHEKYPPNVVVETRRYLRGVVVRVNPITKRRVRESTTDSCSTALVAMRGSQVFVGSLDIFHKLGKMFYKSEDIETEMLIEYVHGNYLEFMELGEACEVVNAMSVGVSDSVLVTCIRRCRKIKPGNFYSFRPSKML